MRTDADQERRNARYPACGRADRETAGPRSIACDAAPSVRWQIAPRRLERCSSAAETPVAERGRLHGASELDGKSGIVAQSIDSCIIVNLKRNDDVRKITGSTTD